MDSKSTTRGAKAQEDVTALLRARNTLLWVVTREETRVERSLTEAAAAANYAIRFWDCATGVSDAEGKPIANDQDPNVVLDRIRNSKERAVFVLRDLHKWLDPVVLRKTRSLARLLQGAPKNEARSIVVLTPSAEVPPELAGHAIVLDWPLPDRAEVAKILDDTLAALPDEIRGAAAVNGQREAAIDASVGLSAEEIANTFARSLVLTRKIDPVLVANEKKRVITREKVLTWYDPDPRGLDAVGGNDLLKVWLRQRQKGFSARARAYGLEAPKGVFLVGLPGCGKSLVAKAIATAYGMPLLRLDLGALQSKYVGDSQANIRKALATAEAVAPCVLWADEIEKSLAGATGQQGDGGVSADALGTLLSWQQERQGSVFLVATANDVRALPPELLRKGRFDEVFWVDLPTARERAEILTAALAQSSRRASGTRPVGPVDITAVASATDGFSGAEVASLVSDASFAAFADGERAITTADLLAAAKTVVPLGETAKEKISDMRAWAKGRARPASSPETESAGPARALDF
jgi:SpoVK/Ycf46/Vps4 family AAA+-type ATPase